jgi:hypothetical protein
MLNCAHVSTPSAVPCARGAHLRAERVEVLVQIIERILPELADGEHLRLVRLRPDVLDEARDEVAVDMLPRAYKWRRAIVRRARSP